MLFVPGKCLLSTRRKKAGMTQKQLAKKIKKTAQRISDYENDRMKMSLPVCRSVAFYLDCSIEDLYEWEMVESIPRSNRQENE